MFPHGDGDGWTECALGHRHWGRYGAAGLLLWHGDRVLLQHRAVWSHHGGTWGLLGGARNSGETAEQTAGREAAEEAGLDPCTYAMTGRFVDDHGGWSYTTVIARTDRAGLPDGLTAETVEVRWVPAGRLRKLPLHPGFAATWDLVRQASSAAGSMVTGKGSDSVSCCPGSARPTSTYGPSGPSR